MGDGMAAIDEAPPVGFDGGWSSRYDLQRLGTREFAELCQLLLRSDLAWEQRRRRQRLLAASERRD